MRTQNDRKSLNASDDSVLALSDECSISVHSNVICGLQEYCISFSWRSSSTWRVRGRRRSASRWDHKSSYIGGQHEGGMKCILICPPFPSSAGSSTVPFLETYTGLFNCQMSVVACGLNAWRFRSQVEGMFMLRSLMAFYVSLTKFRECPRYYFVFILLLLLLLLLYYVLFFDNIL